MREETYSILKEKADELTDLLVNKEDLDKIKKKVDELAEMSTNNSACIIFDSVDTTIIDKYAANQHGIKYSELQKSSQE